MPALGLVCPAPSGITKISPATPRAQRARLTRLPWSQARWRSTNVCAMWGSNVLELASASVRRVSLMVPGGRTWLNTTSFGRIPSELGHHLPQNALWARSTACLARPPVRRAHPVRRRQTPAPSTWPSAFACLGTPLDSTWTLGVRVSRCRARCGGPIGLPLTHVGLADSVARCVTMLAAWQRAHRTLSKLSSATVPVCPVQRER